MKILHLSKLSDFYSIDVLRKVVKTGYYFWLGNTSNHWKVLFRWGDYVLGVKI